MTRVKAMLRLCTHLIHARHDFLVCSCVACACVYVRCVHRLTCLVMSVFPQTHVGGLGADLGLWCAVCGCG